MEEDYHVTLARELVGETVHRRPDVVAAFVVGSAAVGEATPVSDVDMRFIGEVRGPSRDGREPIGVWRQGVYLDGYVVDPAHYLHPRAILSDPFDSGMVCKALILYDTEGVFGRVQRAVRRAHMKPRWLRRRVSVQKAKIDGSLRVLRSVTDPVDAVAACQAAGPALIETSRLPMIRAGINTRGARCLEQLGALWPDLRRVVCEIEGSTAMPLSAVLQGLELQRRDLEFMGKARIEHLCMQLGWMATNGMHREAYHVLWIGAGLAVSNLVRLGEMDRAAALAEEWLRQSGWSTAGVVRDKAGDIRTLEERIMGMPARELP